MILTTLFTLSTEQTQALQELSRSGLEAMKRRARLILAYAEGKATKQAAMEAGISRGRARYWKRQFISMGMEIFQLEIPGPKTEEPGEQVVISSTEESSQSINLDSTGGMQTEPEEIPYPEPQQKIGINLTDTLMQAGRKVWLYHFAIMLSHEQGTLSGDDVEELHDMRVATRRMRSAFGIFGEAFDPKLMKRFMKGLRKIGRALGQVRDMDVILENARLYRGKLASPVRNGLDPILEEWDHTISARRTKLSKLLQSDSYLQFKQEFNRFLHTADELQIVHRLQYGSFVCIRDIIPALIYNRYAAVRAYDTIVPTATAAQLHLLRIEFKKFRYTLEYFREIFRDDVGKLINEIKQYQDHLGELHDTNVACQLVNDFLKRWEENQALQPIRERTNPEPIVTYLAYLHSERYRMMAEFPELWQRFSRDEFRQNLALAISRL